MNPAPHIDAFLGPWSTAFSICNDSTAAYMTESLIKILDITHYFSFSPLHVSQNLQVYAIQLIRTKQRKSKETEAENESGVENTCWRTSGSQKLRMDVMYAHIRMF